MHRIASNNLNGKSLKLFSVLGYIKVTKLNAFALKNNNMIVWGIGSVNWKIKSNLWFNLPSDKK